MSFNTGDNKPTQRGILRTTVDLISKSGRGSMVRSIGDMQGPYAYLMKEALTGQFYYLVARRAKPFKIGGVDYVSTQKALILIAADSGWPILLADWHGRKNVPAWLLYNPREIKQACIPDLIPSERENTRLESKMVNYEYALSYSIKDPSEGQVLSGWLNLKKGIKTQSQLPGFVNGLELKHQERAVDRPRIFNCGCGARYSSVRGKCPACGRPPE